MTTNLKTWAETASAGDYLAYYDSMSVEQTDPGYFVVTHDDSDGVIWEGVATDAPDAYAWAEAADIGSRCGWDDEALAAAEDILRRGGLTLRADDCGLVVARVQS